MIFSFVDDASLQLLCKRYLLCDWYKNTEKSASVNDALELVRLDPSTFLNSMHSPEGTGGESIWYFKKEMDTILSTYSL